MRIQLIIFFVCFTISNAGWLYYRHKYNKAMEAGAELVVIMEVMVRQYEELQEKLNSVKNNTPK